MSSSNLDHLDDTTLIERFEARAIDPAGFRHREHIRLAFALLAREGDLGRAAVRCRAGLRAFAITAGAPQRYHETITWAYLALVHARIHAAPCASSLEFVTRHPDLLDHLGGALARHYDVRAITASPVAREVFVLPVR